MKLIILKASILTCLLVTVCSYNGLTQRTFPQPLIGDENGFVSIFDGETLTNWEGDSIYWKVENGNIVGEVTPETILQRNSFLIWRGGTTGDFELKLDYKVSAQGNSGINYRSYEVEGIQFALKGYQCDIDGKGEWTGQNYEERGRQFLALRGQITKIDKNSTVFEVGSIGDKDALLDCVKQNDWNECHLIVRGNTLIHIINKQLMSVVIDDDISNRKNEGLLGVQVHVGPPMKIEYRNIRIKKF
ncbi:MAG: DUF1080 domain-containing protein [Dysgonamonadaceae bacterium]|jgi:hypothetical protein|nr:DUF1080 domain-containing protein [Dysgonamonadaceae bacterium]MDD3356206.1 DUF1080 domain-containing protein [Dysgonamonadaceae bacterium]MDD3728197.1 DUF1080 domain-containing protein [Dysgonamonadaceae bacterium]MDD4246831.1 DUF1080 domain-containing protein [Dysgonamonadaceae bacterium]MDD4606399.1 DUF1080 domain-containing protein [Dysgonamonadaceae bacterium]